MALYHNFSLPVPRGKVAWAREMGIDHPTPRSSGRGWALRASEGTCSEGTLCAPGKAGASQWLTGSPTRERGVPPATCLPTGRRVRHQVAGTESRRRAERELLEMTTPPSSQSSAPSWIWRRARGPGNTGRCGFCVFAGVEGRYQFRRVVLRATGALHLEYPWKIADGAEVRFSLRRG